MRYPFINRSVAVIKPKKPFLDWLNNLPGNDHPYTLSELQTECTVLLIPEYETDQLALEFIQKIYPDIFANELESYWTIRTEWPRKRDFNTFLDWFAVEFHSEVFDCVANKIIKANY